MELFCYWYANSSSTNNDSLFLNGLACSSPFSMFKRKPIRSRMDGKNNDWTYFGIGARQDGNLIGQTSQHGKRGVEGEPGWNLEFCKRNKGWDGTTGSIKAKMSGGGNGQNDTVWGRGSHDGRKNEGTRRSAECLMGSVRGYWSVRLLFLSIIRLFHHLLDVPAVRIRALLPYASPWAELI